MTGSGRRFKPYADLPGRAAVQVAADLAVLGWVVAWVLVGRAVDTAVSALGGFGTTLAAGATRLADGLDTAGDTAADLPLVGDRLSEPLVGAGGAATELADSGRQLAEQADRLGTLVGVLVAAMPIALVVLVWAGLRWTYARRAAAAAELTTTPAGQSLLALRALTSRSLPVLASVHPDPVAAWRDGDPVVVARLAELETRRRGVRLRG